MRQSALRNGSNVDRTQIFIFVLESYYIIKRKEKQKRGHTEEPM